MAFKLVIVLALPLVLLVNSSLEHMVQTSCRSDSNSCRTFNDYVSNADTYFTSASSFYFVKGTHYLNVTLLIKNVVNLSFVGDDSDIVLSEGCSIIWNGSSNISWMSIILTLNGANETMRNSALLFENSEAVIISNATFSKIQLHSYSGAVQAIGTFIVFKSCKFENLNDSKGGIIYVNNSNVNFCGDSLFLGHVGSALYGSNSQIYFSGNGTFVGNKVGSAIYVQSTNISLNGCFIFYDNQRRKSLNYIFLYSNSIIVALDSLLTMQGVFYFLNNSNALGGAIMLHSTKCLITGYLKFAGNRALIDGGAIHVRNSSLTLQSDESANEFDSFNSECLSKSYSQSIIFCNNSAENTGGAIHLFDGNMTLSGSVIFVANKAQNGGGISIYYSSEPRLNNPNFLMFHEPLDIVFHANVAKRFGGAMYINDRNLDTKLCEYLLPDGKIINKCFFTMKSGLERNVSINFMNNQALAGAGIYGGAIQYCLVDLRNKTQLGYKILQDLTKRSTRIQDLYDNFEALKLCHCINDTTPDLFTHSFNFSVQRGQEFNVSVMVLGEFDIPIDEGVSFTQNGISKKSSIQIIAQHYDKSNRTQCRKITFRVLSEGQTEQIILHPTHCLNNSTLTLNFLLQSCPPGYFLSKNTCKCQKAIFEVTGYKDLCDYYKGLIKCPQQDWMKPILDENLNSYEGFMWSPNCPAHLCRNDKDNWLNFSSDNVDFLCLEYRTAMLCGACLQNYSLTLSSLKCSKCISNNYLSLLLVFTLAGVALIASLLLLHMTVADGTTNGLIFYANMINIIKDLVLPQDELPYNPLTVFLSWLNLDFGIQTCFYTGLSYYSYTWLQFVFPFYLWFLVGLIILACKYSSRAMKLFGSNPVAVLATVVLMSYNKLLHTSQEILSYVTVYYSNGTQEKRWKIDPNLRYFQGWHIPLAMFGLLIITVLLIPYIILLSLGHYLQIHSNKRGLKWLIKIKPILDAYYAPFCKNTRYWFGFLLLIRTCLSIAYSALSNTEHTTILVIVSSVLSGIIWIPWLQHKIYQKNFVNVLEGSFILNVIIVSIATHHITQGRNNPQLFLYYTSVSIAFIEFLAILVFHVWHRLNLKWWCVKYCSKYYKHTSSNQYVSQIKDLDKPGGSASTSVLLLDIREPLLEDSTEL